MNEARTDDRDKVYLDVNSLSEQELEELARKVVEKLRESIRQEKDRSGRS